MLQALLSTKTWLEHGAHVQDVVENIIQESKHVSEAWDTVTRMLENWVSGKLFAETYYQEMGFY